MMRAGGRALEFAESRETHSASIAARFQDICTPLRTCKGFKAQMMLPEV